MNLTINLLKKSERRYQGIVSMKVMAFAILGVILGVTMLVLSMAGISKVTLNANLERARREWARLEPLAAAARENQTALSANRAVLERLDAEAGTRTVDMSRVLRAVQENIPPRMALEHLFAGIEEGTDKQAWAVVRMSGRAQGELTAVEARRNLTADRVLSRFSGEMRLISSTRAEGDNWIFALEARRSAGGAP